VKSSKSSKSSKKPPVKVGVEVTSGAGRSYVVEKIARRSSVRAPRLCILRPTSDQPGPACLLLPEPLVLR
jgi:thioester reductase-like protein